MINLNWLSMITTRNKDNNRSGKWTEIFSNLLIFNGFQNFETKIYRDESREREENFSLCMEQLKVRRVVDVFTLKNFVASIIVIYSQSINAWVKPESWIPNKELNLSSRFIISPSALKTKVCNEMWREKFSSSVYSRFLAQTERNERNRKEDLKTQCN